MRQELAEARNLLLEQAVAHNKSIGKVVAVLQEQNTVREQQLACLTRLFAKVDTWIAGNQQQLLQVRHQARACIDAKNCFLINSLVVDWFDISRVVIIRCSNPA